MLILSGSVRNSVIKEGLRVALLLCRIERNLMKWLGHLVRKHPVRCSAHVSPGGYLRGRLSTCWRDYVSLLAWECLLEDLDEVAREREVWAFLLELRLLRPDLD